MVDVTYLHYRIHHCHVSMYQALARHVRFSVPAVSVTQSSAMAHVMEGMYPDTCACVHTSIHTMASHAYKSASAVSVICSRKSFALGAGY
jgi:hypothetical protein